MKKFLTILIMALLIFSLVGCGEQNSGVPTQFVLPNKYYNASMAETTLPSGLPVKFYITDGSSTMFTSPKATFTGVTGTDKTTISYQIPSSLDNQEYYVIAIVILDTTTYPSFDVLEKATLPSANTVVMGMIVDTSSTTGLKKTLLSKNGGTIEGFSLIDVSVGGAASSLNSFFKR